MAKKKVVKANGRPSIYKAKFCTEMLKFFTRKLVDEKTLEPCRLPTFEKFAVDIGVHRETLANWCTKHPKFFDTYNQCKHLQKNILIQHGLRGAFNPAFAMFVAKNVTDMKDKVEVDQSSEVKIVITPEDAKL